MTHRLLDVGDRPRHVDPSNRVPVPSRAPKEVPSDADHGLAPASTSAFPQRPPPVPLKPGQARHSRSFSQPFPSMLKSVDGPVAGHAGQAMAPADERRDGRTTFRQTDRSSKKAANTNTKDYATGNCMTCGGLVRWPANVFVFKCTTCATINDLDTTESREAASNGRHAGGSTQRNDTKSDNNDTEHIQPVSLLHTKKLVRKGLYNYISAKLEISTENEVRNQVSHQGYEGSHTEAAAAPTHTPNHPNNSRRFGTHFLNIPGTDLREESNRAITKTQRSFSSSFSEKPGLGNHARGRSAGPNSISPGRSAACEPKAIFKELENYIADCLQSTACLNSSFLHHNYPALPRSGPESQVRRKPVPSRDTRMPSRDRGRPRGNTDTDMAITDLDPKLLMLGGVAENGLWWTGGSAEPSVPVPKTKPKRPENRRGSSSSATPLRMDWTELDNWYRTIIGPAEGWLSVFEEIAGSKPAGHVDMHTLENELLQGQLHTQRALLKYTEMLLKRPRRPVLRPIDLRFLLIILENPLLHRRQLPVEMTRQPNSGRRRPQAVQTLPQQEGANVPTSGPLSGQHSGIVKRIVGLVSNSPPLCHNHLIHWWTIYEQDRYVKAKDLFSGFLAYRLLRQKDKKPTRAADDDAVTSFMIPQMRSGQSGAQIHDEIGALSLSNTSKKSTEPEKITSYPDDWQVKAISRVLALIFAANDTSPPRDSNYRSIGHKLPSSDFYVSMVDYIDLIKDFDTWEAKQGTFSFCQYPFLLSVWAKTSILEHDTRRQMQTKARDAFIDSIMSNKSVQQYLTLTVRRECLVDDSLMAVSEVIGSGTDDIKKGLRIKFRGEEGIDGGGLRKEWFQLVIRDVFNPDYGMFLYDEDSQYCYFNPNSLESTDQYFLVGVVLGLAIYNSTILDVPLPPFAFKKLLASVTGHGMTSLAHPPPNLKYTLDDLAEYRPRLAKGLQQLLEYDGDVEHTFALDFVIESEKYGSTTAIPLCDGGDKRPVSNANRREYVDLYVRYILDVSVRRQFDPFRRGFYNVCGGNAFSLFRPGEIELLVRGSDEPLDVNSLRAVAEYQNWDNQRPDGTEPVVTWFWETFQQADPGDQRRLVSFITGSDRIPATGAASLRIKLSCLGDDCLRFPIARTCFNQISLWRYRTRQKLEYVLWRAVKESEGFGLK